METSWVNNWDGVCITLCLSSSRRGTQPFNTTASITPHQENDVPLDPINKNNTQKLCVHVFQHVGGTLVSFGELKLFPQPTEKLRNSDFFFF